MRRSEKEKKAKAGAPPSDAAGANPEKKKEGVEPGAEEKPEGEGTDGQKDNPAAPSDAKTEEEKLQAILKAAYERGLPAVVVFGSQSAKDTEKLLATLDKNMKENKADYIYADTDTLDPNSELGQVARRSEERGLGLGADGKSDLAFTGVYKVEKGADGKYHIGNSVATFWGGRPEIAGIMNDQLRFATRDVSGVQPSDGVRPAPAADGNAPPADGNSPESRPETDQAKKEAEEKAARERAERDAARIKELTELPYNLDTFAAGWGSFIDAHGMKEAGAFRDLTNEFGQEMLKGQFDAAKLKGLMDQTKVGTQQEADAMLSQVNEKLSQSGLTVKATVKDGKVSEMAITEVQAGEGSVSVVVDSNGNVTAYKGLGKGTQANLDEVSLRIAKKAAKDACP